MTDTDFAVRGDHIKLDALLKATGVADSGATAKALIVDGSVRVNDAVELRRGRKLRAGDRVACGGQQIRLVAA